MSLLMDALKKAEQEKKDAAKKLVSGDDDLSVTRRTEITDSHAIVTAAPENSITDPVVESVVEPDLDKTFHTAALDLALEPLEITGHNPLIQKRQPEIIATPNEPGEIDPDATQNVLAEKLSLQSGFTNSGTTAPANTDDTQQISIAPVEQAASIPSDLDRTFHGANLDQSIVAGLYDDTIQGEAYKPGDGRSYDETLPGVPAAQLARDIGTLDQPTPVAAQTLFTATGTVTRSSSGSRWLLISLCMLAVGSAGVFYYYSVTPVSRNIPSPLVAKGVETIISSQEIRSATSNPAPVASSAPAEPVTAGTVAGSPPDAAGQTAAPTQPAVTEVTEAPAAGAAAVPELAAPEAPVVSTVTTPAPAPATAQTELAGLPTVIEPPASLIKISRSAAPVQQGSLISEAFAAWQQGDYELAGTRYQQAYEQTPDNRDVLLGLAAVAGRTGDTAKSIRIYTRMIQMNPLDTVARAALLNLQPGNDVTSSISSIKSMLADNPEQPSLFFTLGKMYAAQANWSSAQQAFFDAYRLDSSNPDYAFNLAVSLDRLGQTGTALDYYTVALGLAETTPAGFDRSVVQNRISSLDAGE